MNRFFSPSPLWQQDGLFILRIITGILIIIHGIEVFDPAKMKDYISWDTFQSSAIMPYMGKGAEFVAGVLLFLGLFTRIACLIIMGTFSYITFFVGNGKFWMGDQHPFLFVLLALVFFFTGPIKFALDNYFFKKIKAR